MKSSFHISSHYSATVNSIQFLCSQVHTLAGWAGLRLLSLSLSLSLSLMLRPTVSQPVYLGIKHPSVAYDHIFISVLTAASLLMWSALSDERTSLSFTIAADPRQCCHSRVRVLWDSRTYSTVSDSRLPFSSPPTTRRVTVEVYDPASTQQWFYYGFSNEVFLITTFHGPWRKHSLSVVRKACLQRRCVGAVVTQLLLEYALPPEYVYRVVAYQWTSILTSLFRISGVMSQYVLIKGFLQLEIEIRLK
jgi:hypothetical protein